MSKKASKSETMIEGTRYKQIREDKEDETFWKNVPMVEDGVLASGLHLMDKHRERTHFDFYNGKIHLPHKEYVKDLPRIKAVKLDVKNGKTFPAPPQNPILVLRGSDKTEEWISLEYYEKNKDKYYIKLGIDSDPKLLGLR